MSVEPCPLCDGSGVIDEQECATCQGEGFVDGNRMSQISGRDRSDSEIAQTQRSDRESVLESGTEPDYDYPNESEPNYDYDYAYNKVAKQDKRVVCSIISSILCWFFFGYIGVFIGGSFGFLLGGKMKKPSLRI